MKKAMCVFCVAVALVFTLFIPANADSLWKIDFSSNISPKGVSTLMNYCWDIGNYLEFYSSESVLSVFFNLVDAGKSSYKLKIVDCGTITPMTQAMPYKGGINSPVNVLVNGVLAVQNIDVNWINDETNSYDIEKFLQQGKNEIIIKMGMLAGTLYKLRSLELTAE